MRGRPVLTIDDEAESLDSLETTLRFGGIEDVLRCNDSRQALAIARQHDVEVVLVDLVMPHVTGEELLVAFCRDFPGLPVIVVTGMSELDKAVQCMKAGAFDYLVKPVEPPRLLSAVRNAMEVRALMRENDRLRDRMLAAELETPEAFAQIVTVSPLMIRILRYAEAVARTPRCILVSGETGVGKELIAQSIHKLSGRDGRMVSVNVAGLDDQMFSDTLFGHLKGAYTGASAERKGLVESAENGTLFLDEIGDLAPPSQTKLLRLLQQGEYFPLGADEPRFSSARVIAATGKDMEALRKSGSFRKDLFYRLATHRIHVPPLRDRLDHDLALLADHFIDLAAQQLGKKRPTAPPDLVPLLRSYTFPGNVRELEAMLFDAVSRHKSGVLSLDSIKTHICVRPADALDGASQSAPDAPAIVFPRPLPTIKQTVQLLVDQALSDCDGRRNVAARMLGITPQALGQRLKRRTAGRKRKD